MKITDWKKAFMGRTIYTFDVDDEERQFVELTDALLEIDSAVKGERLKIVGIIRKNKIRIDRYTKSNHCDDCGREREELTHNKALDDILQAIKGVKK